VARWYSESEATASGSAPYTSILLLFSTEIVSRSLRFHFERSGRLFLPHSLLRAFCVPPGFGAIPKHSGSPEETVKQEPQNDQGENDILPVALVKERKD
jgi:hypothetical protein